MLHKGQCFATARKACQGTVEFLGQDRYATLFPSLHISPGFRGLPEWELAVTVLVSTVPFLGIGSVLEEFRVGLTLADRLPLSKRLTSSSSVPVKEFSHFSLGPGFFPESKCSGSYIYGILNMREGGICFICWDTFG